MASSVIERRQTSPWKHSSPTVYLAYSTQPFPAAARDQPRRITRAAVNAELLEALGVEPEHGRWFRREETRAGGPALVMPRLCLGEAALRCAELAIGS